MPKRTFQPKKSYYRKKQGFRVRSKSATGRRVLKARRQKGRWTLAH